MALQLERLLASQNEERVGLLDRLKAALDETASVRLTLQQAADVLVAAAAVGAASAEDLETVASAIDQVCAIEELIVLRVLCMCLIEELIVLHILCI